MGGVGIQVLSNLISKSMGSNIFVIKGSSNVLVWDYTKRNCQPNIGISNAYRTTCLLYMCQMQAVNSAHKEFVIVIQL